MSGSNLRIDQFTIKTAGKCSSDNCISKTLSGVRYPVIDLNQRTVSYIELLACNEHYNRVYLAGELAAEIANANLPFLGRGSGELK